MARLLAALLVLAACFSCLNAQQCSTVHTPTAGVRPSIAAGYRYQLVATGLSAPRGIHFDNAGNLLVVESELNGGSLSALTFGNDSGCVSVTTKTVVVAGGGLNHGLALSIDGKTLYASSSSSVWSWMYNQQTRSVSDQTVLVTNMTTSDHTTRTLLFSQKVPGMLLVSRGSTSNIDFAATMLSSGHSQIRAFNVHNLTGTPYSFDVDGLRLGWGLRNSVGVAEHPVTGGIFSVENSADQIERDGVDVHEDNPGEEMNFHGYLNGTEYANQGKNYGYPWCFAAWGVSDLPMHNNLKVGSQFAIEASSASHNQNKTDAYCATLVAPRLTFQAHMAPLDMKFRDGGQQAWVTFHGSWDRTDPVGYKLSVVAFDAAQGQPVDSSDSLTAVTDIFANMDDSACPGSCFRPVGIAIDSQNRIFMSSDATGEIYMITEDKSAISTATPTGSATSMKTFGTSWKLGFCFLSLQSHLAVASIIALTLLLL